MKEGSLFVLFVCRVEIFQTTMPFVSAHSCLIGTTSMSRGEMSWFHNVSTYSGEVIEY